MTKVSTEIFEGEHDKKPRGEGYWYFGFGATVDEVQFYRLKEVPTRLARPEKWFPKTSEKALLYSEAKKQAMLYAKEIGFSGTIYLLS
jgi:hypothetical protein